jgi:hypothetical protein
VRADVKHTIGLYIHNSASEKQIVIPEYLQPPKTKGSNNYKSKYSEYSHPKESDLMPNPKRAR